jgi:hypothetical protein
MTHRLFTIASALSLLLGMATVVLWVRSYWTGEFVIWSRLVLPDDPESDFVKMDRYYAIDVGDGTGCFVVGLDDTWAQPHAPMPGWQYQPASPPFNYHVEFSSLWERLGFYWGDGPDGLTDLAVPCWTIAGIFAVAPAMQVVLYRRGRRDRKTHHCSACGYDLRATPDRCPECGTAVPKNTEANA